MIVTSFEPNFIPLLKQFKEHGIVVMHQQFGKLLFDADIPNKFIGEFITSKMREDNIKTAILYLTDLQQHKLTTDELISPAVAKFYNDNLVAYLYQRLENIFNIWSALDVLQPNLIIVHNDVEPMNRLLAFWAKSSNKPCLHIPHAVYLDNDGRGAIGTDVHDLVTPSHIAVAGPYQANWYIKRGANPDHVYLTGLPQFERLANWQMERERACRLFKLQPEIPIVTYKSSWRQDTNLSGCHDGVEESFLAFLAVAKQLPDIQYIVSCHPRGNNLDWHKQQVEAAGVKAIVTQDHLDVLLACTDVLISYGPSNVILEAAAYGNMHLIVTNDSQAFSNDSEIIKCTNLQLYETLLQVLQKPLPDYRKFVAKYLYQKDGKNIERLIGLIKELYA